MSTAAATSQTTSQTARGTASEAKVRISARATLLLLLVLVAGTLSIAPMRAYSDARERVAELEDRARSLDARNDRLESQIARLYDPAHLEWIARACLGLVERGETAFVTVPEEGAKPSVADC
jgi:cell division protein FtsB